MQTTPYWQETAAIAPPPAAALPAAAEILIIGGGYSGLSAALVCADAGREVTVIDSGAFADGASVRNGGMAGAHPRIAFSAAAARWGEPAARALFQEAQTALTFTRDLIAAEQIACDLQFSGRVQAAWTAAHFAAQQQLARELQTYTDVKVEILQREELQQHVSAPCYAGGLFFPEHGGLNPRLFYRGLLAAAARRGVRLLPHCAARQAEKRGQGFTVQTAKGALRADKVILTANGYLHGRFGWWKRRVFPLPSYIAVTAPQPPQTLRRLLPGARMMVETRAKHCYYRLTPDGRRLLFGGRAAMCDIPLPEAARRLRRALAEIFPDLAAAEFSHCWSGCTGYTFNHLPHTGVHNGIHYAMGYSGSGVVMAPCLGMKAAYQALQDERGDTAFRHTALAARPFYRGGRKPLFLRIADKYYRYIKDKQEDAEQRRQ